MTTRPNLAVYNETRIRRQREVEQESTKRESNIFKGCVIYINGLTNPSNEDLMRLIRYHGGQNTSQRKEQTHFLCNSFTTQQVLALKNRSKPEPFFYVTEEWVLCSVQNQKKMSEWQFMPIQLKGLPMFAANIYGHVGGTSSSSSSSSSSIPPKKGGRAIDAEKQPVEFLASYLSNSRLHFIGTYRDRVSEVRREMLQEGTLSSSGNGSNSSSSGGGGGRGGSVPSFLQADTGRGSLRERVVLHADIDCFFVQAAVRSRPELQEDLHEGKVIPVCVAHTSGAGSEISSCNYSARQSGVRNGMWMKNALEKCKNLKVIDYDYPAYDSVSRAVLRVFFSFPDTLAVASISVDEAYLELMPGADGEAAARSLRQQIFDLTGCKVSVGVGSNMLQARIATMSAKPPHGNGVFVLDSAGAQEHLADLNVGVLPGVGPVTCKVLQGLGFFTCRDLQQVSKDELARQLPGKQAGMLFDMCRGLDCRIPALEPIQSISIECNWGMRFTSLERAVCFLGVLCDELAKRMDRTRVRNFSECTVKVSIRHPDAAKEPVKFLGCGLCVDKSKKVSSSDSHGPDTDSIRALVFPLFRGLMSEVPVADLRGVSIQLGSLKDESSSEGHVIKGKQRRLDDMFSNSPPKRNSSSSLALPVASESVSDQPRVKNSRRRSNDDDDDDDDGEGKAASTNTKPPEPPQQKNQDRSKKFKEVKDKMAQQQQQQQSKIEDIFRQQENDKHDNSELNFLSKKDIAEDAKARQQLAQSEKKRNSVASNSSEPAEGRKRPKKADHASFIGLSRSEVIDLSISQNDPVPVQSHGQGRDVSAEAEAPGPTGWQLRDGLFFYSDLELHVRAWVTQWQHDYNEQSTQESENESDPAACALEDLAQELRAQALDLMRCRPDVGEAVLKAMHYCGKRVEPAKLRALWAEAEGVVKEDVQRAFTAAHGAPLLLHWMHRGTLN